MATAEDVRRIALALPESAEKAAWGMPTFRVKDKIFASLAEDGDSMGFAVDKEERAELIAAEPEIFFLQAGHDDNYAFARVRLSRIGVTELTEVLADAWRRIAPVRVRRAHEAELPGADGSS